MGLGRAAGGEPRSKSRSEADLQPGGPHPGVPQRANPGEAQLSQADLRGAALRPSGPSPAPHSDPVTRPP